MTDKIAENNAAFYMIINAKYALNLTGELTKFVNSLINIEIAEQRYLPRHIERSVAKSEYLVRHIERTEKCFSYRHIERSETQSKYLV